MPLTFGINAQRSAHVLKSLSGLIKFSSVEVISRAVTWGFIVLLPAITTTPTECGIIALLIAIENAAADLFRIGQDKSTLKHYAESQSSLSYCRASAEIITWASLALVAITAVTCSFESTLIPISSGEAHWLTILALSACLANFTKIPLAMARVHHDTAQYAMLRLVPVALRFFFLVILIGNNSAIASYITACFLSQAVTIALSWRTFSEIAKTPHSKHHTQKAFRFGAPLLLFVLGAGLLGHANRLLIADMLGPQALACYAVSYALATCPFFVFAAITSYVEPKIYRARTSHARERLLRINTSMCLSLGAAALFVVTLAIPYAMTTFYRDYHEAGSLIPILTVGVLVHPFYMQGNIRLTATGRTSLLPHATIASGTIAIFAALYLIPKLGTRGAAIAYIIGSASQAAIILLLSILYCKQPTHLRQTVSNVMMTAPVIMAIAVFPEKTYLHQACYLTVAVTHATVLRSQVLRKAC